MLVDAGAVGRNRPLFLRGRIAPQRSEAGTRGAIRPEEASCALWFGAVRDPGTGWELPKLRVSPEMRHDSSRFEDAAGIAGRTGPGLRRGDEFSGQTV